MLNSLIRRQRQGVWLVLALVAVSLGCILQPKDEGGGGSEEPDPQQLVDSAWVLFEQEEWAGARVLFGQAFALDDSLADAYNGLGWCLVQLGEFAGAVSSFEMAIALQLPGSDAYAGTAVALYRLEPPSYEGALAAARSALEGEEGYVFAHDESFDWRDLHLYIAFCCFDMADYDAANEEVGILGGEMADPASEDFVGDLLAELERLRGELGA